MTKWYASKTLLAALALFLAAIIQEQLGVVVDPSAQLLFVSIIMAVLRKFTDGPLE